MIPSPRYRRTRSGHGRIGRILDRRRGLCRTGALLARVFQTLRQVIGRCRSDRIRPRSHRSLERFRGNQTANHPANRQTTKISWAPLSRFVGRHISRPRINPRRLGRTLWKMLPIILGFFKRLHEIRTMKTASTSAPEFSKYPFNITFLTSHVNYGRYSNFCRAVQP